MKVLSKIHILDEHVSNKIAAGEVIERPSSIVKELIENCIDAGSTKIEISIKEGGIDFIRIKDNGEGIDEKDIEKAFLRHATSKIKDDRDLLKLKTLGFRGEALASIAVISHITLRTSNNNEGKGFEAIIEGGNFKGKMEIAFVKGTDILVTNIFYNTPARLKYMKSIQRELGYIIEYVNKLSLAHPKISFYLINNERLILRTLGDGNLLHVISAIYGNNIAKSMLAINLSDIDFSITGFISNTEITRANKNYIHFFINGRYIKNFQLVQALLRGYKDLLMINRYPISIINIKMDPSIVDINVHPAKLEARFSKEKELLNILEEAIHEGLKKYSLIPEPLNKNTNYKNSSDIQSSYESFFNKEDSLNTYVHEELSQIVVNSVKDSSEILPIFEPVAQIFGTYILAQNNEGLYLIDQHAAHERINYENNIKKIKQAKLEKQELLIPITLDYSKSEVDQILLRIDELKGIGLDVELFGKQTFIIRSVPNWVTKGQEQILIDKSFQIILEDRAINILELNKEVIADESCKSSLKANKFISIKEMEALLEQLRNTENPYSCPHGRPVIIQFSKYDIEKMFKRAT